MDILHQRLVNQQISVHRFNKAGELVHWLAAIQAQDYAMAKWAIGCRLEGIAEAQVEKEFNEGKILRTHLLRPTWHFVSPKDIRWMLKLTAPKIKTFTKKHHQDLGIDAGILKRSKKIIEKAMMGGGPLTRKEIQQALTGSHIKTNENRLGFLLMDAELDGLICSAGRRGKQFVYGLLDEMLPEHRIPEGDEAIALLAGKYFTGHGPATVPDFAWWSGLSLKEINRTLPGMKSVLLSENIGGQTYWFSKTMKEIADKPKSCYFLPAFDEYLIGYKDRSHSLDPAFAKGVLSSNGIFNPVILEKGKTVGTWKRREQRSGLLIDLFPLSSSVALPQRGIAIAIKNIAGSRAGKEGSLNINLNKKFMMEKQKPIFTKRRIKTLSGFSFCLFLVSFIVQTVPVQDHAENAFRNSNQVAELKRRPNILWITTEGVPLKTLSCYGSHLIQTPNIDRIAREGMLFRNSFCTNALCAPSRATLLTGKYDHQNGMLTNPGNTTQGQTQSFFDPTQETFARLLQQNGYKTGIVGKWHLVDQDGRPSNPGIAGFDYFAFKMGAGGPFYDSTGYLQNPVLGSKEIQKRNYSGYITDNITDLAIKGMEQMKGGPFLMAIQYFNAHRPFDPPHKYEHLYDSVQIPEPATFWDDYHSRSAAAREAHMRIEDMMDFNPPKDLTRRQRRQWSYQQLMRHFLGTLKAQDDNIGRLLDYLDKSGLAENTIVVFTGDHGFFLGDHGWFDKRFMYEEALRVPWLIRYPGLIKPGSKSDAWVVNIDNAPTILDMAGIKIPEDMQGRSLLPVFAGKTPSDWRHSMYYHYYEFAPPHWVMPCYGIRTERYKLIYYYTVNEWELFDLQKDPDEMENLLVMEGMDVKPGYEDVLKDLLAQLTELRKKYKDDTGNPVKFWPRKSYN